MVGGLKVLTVKSGREREFEALFAELRNEEKGDRLLFWEERKVPGTIS